MAEGYVEFHGVSKDAPEFVRDLADGYALRRLREALPEGWGIRFYDYVIVHDGRLPNGGPVQPGRVHMGVGSTYSSVSYPEGAHYGATIAEAADKCREALA